MNTKYDPDEILTITHADGTPFRFTRRLQQRLYDIIEAAELDRMQRAEAAKREADSAAD